MHVSSGLIAAALAATLSLTGSASLRAADYPAVPVGQGVNPAIMPQTGGGGCTTCGGGPVTGGTGCSSCKSCGGKHQRAPYVVNLCPGACFGYFQTQWRKWDDVCPYPYQGIGVSDAPKPPSPVLPSPITQPRPGLPGPRSVEPKPTGALPAIPLPGTGS
jgi:hypothetical protein